MKLTEGKFTCPHCHGSYNKEILKNHLRENHLSKIECPVHSCEDKFVKLEDFVLHLQKIHFDNKSFLFQEQESPSASETEMNESQQPSDPTEKYIKDENQTDTISDNTNQYDNEQGESMERKRTQENTENDLSPKKDIKLNGDLTCVSLEDTLDFDLNVEIKSNESSEEQDTPEVLSDTESKPDITEPQSVDSTESIDIYQNLPPETNSPININENDEDEENVELSNYPTNNDSPVQYDDITSSNTSYSDKSPNYGDRNRDLRSSQSSYRDRYKTDYRHNTTSSSYNNRSTRDKSYYHSLPKKHYTNHHMAVNQYQHHHHSNSFLSSPSRGGRLNYFSQPMFPSSYGSVDNIIPDYRGHLYPPTTPPLQSNIQLHFERPPITGRDKNYKGKTGTRESSDYVRSNESHFYNNKVQKIYANMSPSRYHHHPHDSMMYNQPPLDKSIHFRSKSFSKHSKPSGPRRRSDFRKTKKRRFYRGGGRYSNSTRSRNDTTINSELKWDND